MSQPNLTVSLIVYLGKRAVNGWRIPLPLKTERYEQHKEEGLAGGEVSADGHLRQI